MTTALAQTHEIAFPVKLRSAKSKRGVDARSLRPGSWLRLSGLGLLKIGHREGLELVHLLGDEFVVIQNSSKLAKIELRYGPGNQRVHSWDSFLVCCEFIGHGRKRRWWPMLPAWARKWVCEYGRPE